MLGEGGLQGRAGGRQVLGRSAGEGQRRFVGTTTATDDGEGHPPAVQLEFAPPTPPSTGQRTELRVLVGGRHAPTLRPLPRPI